MKLFTKRMAILWVTVLLAIGFAAFSEGESLRSRERREKRKGIRDTQRRLEEAIKAGKVTVGMTKEQVTEILGNPADINQTVVSGRKHEQWCYGSISEGTDMYVYFDDGKVMGWQH